VQVQGQTETDTTQLTQLQTSNFTPKFWTSPHRILSKELYPQFSETHSCNTRAL